ncbi:hypothetical protein [Paenibacillus sp. USDA918EY]|uniref:Uncharacterized protein n=1 Tax=Paenibacillus albilobatus TaxID=2716884 RepID=A0A919XLV5_9BACL|nr:hypothetical protein [Paenibacillus sp. USDA918EY]GIO34606.1 hypothetical protein J2TS6_57470 [Paenibacillus albilobatus]
MEQAEYAKNFIVGKGTYLVAYHNEGYTNINEAYLRLLGYAGHYNLQLESNKKVVVELG